MCVKEGSDGSETRAGIKLSSNLGRMFLQHVALPPLFFSLKQLLSLFIQPLSVFISHVLYIVHFISPASLLALPACLLPLH